MKEIRTTVLFDMRAPAFGSPAPALCAAALEMAAFTDSIGVSRINLGRSRARVRVGKFGIAREGHAAASRDAARDGSTIERGDPLQSGSKVVEMSRKFGGPYGHLDLDRLIVPGHEYVGEIIDYGPGSRRPLKIGTRVTSQPVMRHAGGHSIVGQSHDCPGGFGEYMLLDENALMEIPGGLDDERAAMTEPLSVGLEHARAGEPMSSDIPLVLGCGAIGLGVIAGLKLMNMGPILAADLDARRRDIALRMGGYGDRSARAVAVWRRPRLRYPSRDTGLRMCRQTGAAQRDHPVGGFQRPDRHWRILPGTRGALRSARADEALEDPLCRHPFVPWWIPGRCDRSARAGRVQLHQHAVRVLEEDLPHGRAG